MPRLSDRVRRRIVAKSLSVTEVVENMYARALVAALAAVHREFETLAQRNPRPTSGDFQVLGAHVQTLLPALVRKYFHKMADAVKRSNARALATMGLKDGKVVPIRLDAKPVTVGGRLAKNLGDVGLEAQIQKALQANIDLVVKAGRAYAADVQAIFFDPKNVGLRAEDMAKLLLARGNVSKHRAELIARDQVLKLNGQINRIRQQNAGVESYTWSTSHDERVRHEHELRDGKPFRWDLPPDDGHPGEPIQCRCIPIPIITELDDIFGGPALPPPAPPVPRPEPAPLPPPVENTPPGPTAKEIEKAEKAARFAAIQAKLAAEKARIAAEIEAAKNAPPPVPPPVAPPPPPPPAPPGQILIGPLHPDIPPGTDVFAPLPFKPADRDFTEEELRIRRLIIEARKQTPEALAEKAAKEAAREADLAKMRAFAEAEAEARRQLELPLPYKEPVRSGTFEEGIHVKTIFNGSGFTQKQLEFITKPISDRPEILDYLKRKPLQVLSLENSKYVEGASGPAVGLYTVSKRKLSVGSVLSEDINQPLKMGKLFTIQTASKTHDEYLQGVFTHELGHHIHLHDSHDDSRVGKDVDYRIRKTFEGVDKGGPAVSQYAKENHMEYWAESFAAYILHEKEFLQHDPLGHAMVLDVLKMRKIL